MTQLEGGAALVAPRVACDVGLACSPEAAASYLLQPKCDDSRVPTRFACDGCAVELASRGGTSCLTCGDTYTNALDGFNIAVLA